MKFPGKMTAAIAMTICLIAPAVGAQETKSDSIRVSRIEFCAEIEDRECKEKQSLFTNTVTRIFCFTHIEGAKEKTSVTHKWYLEDKLLAEVPLKVGSISWRTKSSKAISPEWTGKWRVEVVSADGKLLTSKEFVIEKGE